MVETIRVDRKELTADEILRELERGNRVIVDVDILGRTMNVAIRRRGGTYYCDTALKLLRDESDGEMRTRLERYRLARPTGDELEREAAQSTGG
ncbi:hypothetical protein EA472_08325 [Natrarchaeobius oligotrophus]|uniref:DUF8001 domain-containing protein n=1 Tax=Natrarchaeobius chitinivorans TaxID=1679083 RepID=A0A3N6MYF4_NATCH|nr:hypothetical protein EA472_08325 [Natrarchaeobius chitinivorans]